VPRFRMTNVARTDRRDRGRLRKLERWVLVHSSRSFRLEAPTCT
jgi:hypothetical protein